MSLDVIDASSPKLNGLMRRRQIVGRTMLYGFPGAKEAPRPDGIIRRYEIYKHRRRLARSLATTQHGEFLLMKDQKWLMPFNVCAEILDIKNMPLE